VREVRERRLHMEGSHLLIQLFLGERGTGARGEEIRLDVLLLLLSIFSWHPGQERRRENLSKAT
jgi:hypothetical protein